MNCEEMVGKTLGEALTALVREGSEEVIHLGAKSAYFLIGTVPQIDGELDRVSEDCQKRYFERATELKTKLAMAATKAVYDGEMDYMEYADKLSRLSKEIEGSVKEYRSALKRHETFVPMRERKIKDAYSRETEEGISIIITGCEEGAYWTRQEFLAAREKKKKKEAKA